MKKISLIVFVLIVWIQGSVFAEPIKTEQVVYKEATTLEEVAPYPKAEKGMIRYGISLPLQENENDFCVEIIIGKTMVIDNNAHFFAGILEEKSLKGWGYSYYVIDEIQGPASTLMASLPGSEHEEFVRTYLGKSGFVRYNSKLPIVIYAPEGFEVNYRIWKAQPEMANALEK